MCTVNEDWLKVVETGETPVWVLALCINSSSSSTHNYELNTRVKQLNLEK